MSETPDESKRHEATEQRSSAKRARRCKRLKRISIVVAILVVVYALLGFVVVPVVITKIVTPRISERLVGEFTLAKARFNPFTFSLLLEGAQVTDGSGRPVISFERFEGQFRPSVSLVNRRWWFEYAKLFEPEVLVELDAHGAVNLASLVLPSPDPEEPTEPLREIPRIAVFNLEVNNAAAQFRDLRFNPVVERSLRGLDFHIRPLYTDSHYDNPHNLTAMLGDKAYLDWTGTARIDPLTAAGTFRLNDLDLAPFSPYARPFSDLVLEQGRLSLEIEYALAPVRTGQRLMVKVTRCAVEDLRISADGQPVSEAGTIELLGLNADVDESLVTLDAFNVRGFELIVRRGPDGSLQLVRAASPAFNESTSPAASTTQRAVSDQRSSSEDGERRDLDTIPYPIQKLLTALGYLAEDLTGGWSVEIKDVDVSHSAVRFEDRSTPRPVEIELADLTLKAGPITSEDGFRAPLHLSATSAAGGTLAIDGELAPMDRSMSLELEVGDLALAPAAPYLPTDLPEPADGIELVSAALSLDGSLNAAVGQTHMDGGWKGDVKLTDLQTARPGADPPLTLNLLGVNGLLKLRRPVDGGPLQLDWDGRVELADLNTRARKRDSLTAVQLGALATDGALQLGGADAGLEWNGGLSLNGLVLETDTPSPTAVQADLIELADARLLLREGDGVLEAKALTLATPRLETVIPPDADSGNDAEEAAPPAADTSSPPTPEPGDDFNVRLATLRVTDGSFSIEDRRTDPAMTLAGTGLQVVAENIDTAGGTAMKVDVTSRFAEIGTVDVEGQLDPFRPLPFMDLQIVVSDVPLRTFSPAAEPRIGYAIERGQMTLTMPIRVQEGQLDGSLDAQLRSFYLGEKTPSESAPDVPIKLGLDLLRDADDVIRADIGLSGDTTAPGFTFGGLIWKAAFNLLGNVATAPFKIVGGILGLGEEVDLSRVAFEPGSDEFSPGSAAQLDLLARGLVQRPALRLAAIGRVGAEDEAALREAELDRLLSQRREAEPAEDATAALRALFAERVGQIDRPTVPVPPGRRDQSALTPDAMRARLLDTVDLTPEALTQLARRRVERVKSALVEQGGLSPDRIEAITPGEGQALRGADGGARVDFELLGTAAE